MKYLSYTNDGFKSRWIISLSCKYSIPFNNCLLYSFILSEWNGSFMACFFDIKSCNVLS